MTLLEKYSNDIYKLCKDHKVKKLYAFGPVLTEQFSPTSDIDLIVDFDNLDVSKYADNYFAFKFSLQDVFKRPVDLLEEKAIKNPYFKRRSVKNDNLSMDIHGYDSVSDDIIWGIVTNHLPMLKTEVQKLLEE